ncbi:MAG: hypothetical protein ACI4VP_04520 [Clostridia bacterium]
MYDFVVVRIVDAEMAKAVCGHCESTPEVEALLEIIHRAKASLPEWKRTNPTKLYRYTEKFEFEKYFSFELKLQLLRIGVRMEGGFVTITL